jgi:hypothetical protein
MCYPFSSLVDVFLNTNNPTVTEFFGYNNNATMGNRNCIYYVTLYNTKGNQEEEQCPFLRHCTVIAKYLRKLRNEEQVILGLLSSGPGNIKTFDFLEPNFMLD